MGLDEVLEPCLKGGGDVGGVRSASGAGRPVWQVVQGSVQLMLVVGCDSDACTRAAAADGVAVVTPGVNMAHHWQMQQGMPLKA